MSLEDNDPPEVIRRMEEARKKGKVKIVLDKDVFHPLDHHIGTSYCLSLNGGRKLLALKLHWQYWNDFKKHTDLAWLYRWTTCLLGRHKWSGHGWRRIGEGKWQRTPSVCWCCPAQRDD